jgi:transposase/ribosomal protein S8E
MAYNFFPVDREQMYLFPPSLKDWVPEEDLSWFILDAVGEMDLLAFYEGYRADGLGGKGYEPSMMVSLLLYSYCLGERSSRKIEWLCQRDVGFKVVAANLVPDHSSIARFRQDHEEKMKALFLEVLRLCAGAGLVKVGVVALDGTKIKGNAALEANRTKESIESEVEKMFREAAAKDEEEDRLYGGRRGDELPEGFRTRSDRLQRLKACREQIERKERAVALEREAKLAQRSEKEARTGRKVRGRKPKDKKPEPAKANVTDPDSRIMKTRKGYVQGYNAQAVVTQEQIILAAEVTQEANDVKQLEPMVERVLGNVREVLPEAEVEVLLGDAGYWSKAVGDTGPAGPELLVATTKDWKQRKAARDAPPPRGRIPRDLSARDRMERKLLTKRGRRLYKIRGKTVEPVFGQIKDARRCDRFMRRGENACASEWKLIAATHNLLKLYKSGKRRAEKRPENGGGVSSRRPAGLKTAA